MSQGVWIIFGRCGLPPLFAKDETTQFVAQLLNLPRVAGCAETLGQPKECLLFLLGGLDADLLRSRER
jgi:hypothetical protein